MRVGVLRSLFKTGRTFQLPILIESSNKDWKGDVEQKNADLSGNNLEAFWLSDLCSTNTLLPDAVAVHT